MTSRTPPVYPSKDQTLKEIDYILKRQPELKGIVLGLAIYCASEGVHPFVALAQAFKESRFDPTKVNRSSDARGILQQLPTYWCEYGSLRPLTAQQKEACINNVNAYIPDRDRHNPAHAAYAYCVGMRHLWQYYAKVRNRLEYPEIVFYYGAGPGANPQEHSWYWHYIDYTINLFNEVYPAVVEYFVKNFGFIDNFQAWMDHIDPRFLQEKPDLGDRSKWKPWFFDTNRYPVPVFGYTEQVIKPIANYWTRLCSS